MRIAFVLLAGTLAATRLAAQAGGPVDERTRDVAGCYDLTVGRWTIGTGATTTPLHSPPSHFRLDTLPPPNFPSNYHAIAPSSGASQLNTDSWRWVEKDGLVVRWSSNTISGVQLELRVDADSLFGTAFEFGEELIMSRQFPATSAIAHRARCKPPLAPTPAAARSGNPPVYPRRPASPPASP